jgi:hypothetical protein
MTEELEHRKGDYLGNHNVPEHGYYSRALDAEHKRNFMSAIFYPIRLQKISSEKRIESPFGFRKAPFRVSFPDVEILLL